MKITELGYIVVHATDTDAWRVFAERNLGAMATEGPAGELRVRLDSLSQRILVLPASQDRFYAAGWVAPDLPSYEANRASVVGLLNDVREGTASDCAARGVEAFFTLDDPSGNHHEVCWGRTQVASPFVSPTGVRSFVTDGIGLGHVVLPCATHYDEGLRFFQEQFGFSYSDFFYLPDEAGSRKRVHFLHGDNARQHSLAMGEAPAASGLHHFMVEVSSLDEVGRALDAATDAGLVRRSLGRHINDSMVSFYMETPGGFLVEFGYDGEPKTWVNHEVRHIPQGSHWGHRWL